MYDLPSKGFEYVRGILRKRRYCVMEDKRCYTVKELQEILGISRPTVYELLKRNEFRWIQIGSSYRISKKSFDEWLDHKMETV